MSSSGKAKGWHSGYPARSLAQGCPVWPGIGVQFAVDWVSTLLWTSRSVWRGLGVQFGLENAHSQRQIGACDR